MKTTVLVFHPNLETTSTANRALAQAAKEAGLEIRNLYQLYPDFQIDMQKEQQVLEAADRIVFQFPMFWYGSPALVAQYLEQVFQYGWAYGSTGNALSGKEFFYAVTTGVGASDYSRTGDIGYTVTDLYRPLQATSDMTGMRLLKPFITYRAMGMEAAAIKEQADAYLAYLQKADLEVLGAHE